jgi:3,2-trans-enoyl-CoA isomerase
MSNFQLSRNGRVAGLRLDRNSLNTLAPEFVAELAAALDEVEKDDGVGALVLSSAAPKFFSAGWDLPALLQADEETFRSFYREFCAFTLQLTLLPKPTVACLGGITVAGGAILALACDWREVSEGMKVFGLNEVDLGVPMPLPAILLAERCVGASGARDLVLAGRLLSPAEAAAFGLCERVVPSEDLEDVAFGRAEQLAAKPPGSAGVMKSLLARGFSEACAAGAQADEDLFVSSFLRPEVRPQLEAAAARLVPR